MQEYKDIGRGRSARQVFGLNQIDIVPSRRTRSSRDVDTSWRIDAYDFDFPIMTHPTDAVVSPEFAIEFGKAGGLPVINAEGLWGRAKDLDAAFGEIVSAAERGYFGSFNEGADEDVAAEALETPEFAANQVLQRLHQQPLDLDLLQERLQQVRDSGVRFAVRVSPQRARELAPTLIAGGIDLLVIQGTLISAEHVDTDGEPLNLKEFIGSLDVPVIAGGVVDYTTAMHLMRTGAAGVLVGFGGGAVSATRATIGVEAPMATAIADVAEARRDYMDESGGRYVQVIADGGMGTSGSFVKAFALGADAVMLGAPLARATEAPGKGMHWGAEARHQTLPRGYRTNVGTVGALEEILYGPSHQADGTTNFIGALRRAMASTGYVDLKSFQRCGVAVNAHRGV